MKPPVIQPIGTDPPGPGIALRPAIQSALLAAVIMGATWGTLFGLASAGFLILIGQYVKSALEIVPSTWIFSGLGGIFFGAAMLALLILRPLVVSSVGITGSPKSGLTSTIVWPDLTGFESKNSWRGTKFIMRGQDGTVFILPTGIPVAQLRNSFSTYMPVDHPLREHILNVVLSSGKPAPSDPS